MITLENTVAKVKQSIAEQLSKSNQLANEKQKLDSASTKLNKKIQQQQQKQASLVEDLDGLALVESTLKERLFPPQPLAIQIVMMKSVGFQLIVIM